jgi:putative copper resistance protein D
MDPLAVAFRLGNFATLSLLAGVPLFLRMSLGGAAAKAILERYRTLLTLLAATALATSLCGILATAASMAGTDIFPVDWETVELVVRSTTIGQLAMVRVGILLLLIVILFCDEARHPVLLLTLSSAAAATLAWSGHAASGENLLGWVHRLADVMHILAAALWIGGMAALILLLPDPDYRRTAKMLHAFSWIGSGIVSLLVISGLVNLALIVPIDRLMALPETQYGRLLALKLLLFMGMLLLAANNRFRLSPRFDRHAPNTAKALRSAIAIELLIGFAVLTLVAWLGTLDPEL